jgi:hypothetical protein
MSVNKDVFRRRETNYDFQSAGTPVTGWAPRRPGTPAGGPLCP